MWKYKNPVEIIAGEGALAQLTDQVENKPYALITYDSEYFRGITDRISTIIGSRPAGIINRVASNPSLDNLQLICQQFQAIKPVPKLLIAVGGGSVIDVCKVLSACSGDYQTFYSLLTDKNHLSHSIPYIAIPTTAGTGSEVTCWATVWDQGNNLKYSLSDPLLYAKSAILTAELTVELPWDITLSTALDALSHALESLWNRNRNPISSHYAVSAARQIIDTLPKLDKNPTDLLLRESLQQASLLAGLAFSNTKTSIAHNISYAITLEKGTAHGIACSFTLPMIIRASNPDDKELLFYINEIFSATPASAADQLETFFENLNVPISPQDYGYDQAQWTELIKTAGAGQRGRNYPGEIHQLISLYQLQFNQKEEI